jgi:RNA polymerase sigma-70 factor (ECF subfamily)
LGRAVDVPSDDALVAAIGDPGAAAGQQAMAEIYRRHGGSVWAIAQRVCRRAELAEQVCEAVFVELWSHPDRFTAGRGSLRSWLVARAHARAVDTRRSPVGSTPPPSADVELTGHAEALSAPARRAVDQLEDAERDAILLAYLGGHGSAEIARLLGTAEDTVKARIRRGLEALRRTLDAEGVTT